MSCNETLIDAPPAAVFEVLADARRYPNWVLGASYVRSVGADWPQPGARFRHAIGVPPLLLRDSTSVVAVQPERELTLRVGIGVLGSATVQLRLDPAGEGVTRVSLVERPVGGPVRWLHNPLQDVAFWFRNEWSLLRLKRLTENLARGTARPAPVPTDLIEEMT